MLMSLGFFGSTLAAPVEETPEVVSFSFSRSGSSCEQARSYRMEKTERGCFVWIELYYTYTIVLPLNDGDVQAFSALTEELELSAWDGFSGTDADVLDGESFSMSVSFADGSVISAGGTNCFPERYYENKEKLEEFFFSLIKEFDIAI